MRHASRLHHARLDWTPLCEAALPRVGSLAQHYRPGGEPGVSPVGTSAGAAGGKGCQVLPSQRPPSPLIHALRRITGTTHNLPPTTTRVRARGGNGPVNPASSVMSHRFDTHRAAHAQRAHTPALLPTLPHSHTSAATPQPCPRRSCVILQSTCGVRTGGGTRYIWEAAAR